MTYKLKHIFCNNPECRLCAEGVGHGPYWHASYVINGKTYTVFLGKELKPFNVDKRATEDRRETRSPDPERQEKSASNSAENRFGFRKSNDNRSQAKPHSHDRGFINPHRMAVSPPTQKDFENDLRMLKNTCRADNLKSLYRKLIKKYHPDRYPDLEYINSWMAEINGFYDQHRKTLSHP